MKRFLGFVKKEFLHIFRDTRTLFILFGIPAAQILIFGYAVSTDVKNAGIAVLDLSHDEVTQKLTDKIISSGFFRRTENLLSYNDIDKVFKKGKTKAVIVFGEDFGKKLTTEGKASMSIIADGSEPNVASLVTNYTMSIIIDFAGGLAGPAQSNLMRIKPEVKMFYNPELKSHFMFVPGVITLILILICALMTSVTYNQGEGVWDNGGIACFSSETGANNPGEGYPLFYPFICQCTSYSCSVMAGIWTACKREPGTLTCGEYVVYTYESYPGDFNFYSLEQHATGYLHIAYRAYAANNTTFWIYLPN